MAKIKYESIKQEGDISDSLLLAKWLQTTMKGRYLMMQITFPIANQFNTHPERVPIGLVVEIVKAVRNYYRFDDFEK